MTTEEKIIAWLLASAALIASCNYARADSNDDYFQRHFACDQNSGECKENSVEKCPRVPEGIRIQCENAKQKWHKEAEVKQQEQQRQNGVMPLPDQPAYQQPAQYQPVRAIVPPLSGWNVPKATQRARDNTRAGLLSDELNTSIQAYQTAVNSGDMQSAHAYRRNIIALKRELRIK